MASGGDQLGTEIPTDIARLPVGDALRTRREQLGWSLPDVAAWLRIRLSYLEALEAGQVGKLPGGAYAMGFLRAYAAALGLDPDDMIRRFRGETKEVTRKPELSFPVPVPERGVPAGAIVLLGVVVVVAAYVGWYEFGGRLTHEAHTVPPVPEALSSYAGDNTRGPSPQVATVMPGPGQTPSPLPAGETSRAADTDAQKQGSSSPETAGVAAELPPPAQNATTQTAAPTAVPTQTATSATGTSAAPTATAPATAAPVAGATTPAAPPADNGQVTLNAVSNSWVQVRQVGGKVIYDRVLQAGDHWSVPADAGEVVLSTGNAGGITVSTGGVTSAVLGRVGGVRRGIPLTADAVKSGSIASAEAAAKTPAPGSAAPGTAAAAAAPATTPASGMQASGVQKQDGQTQGASTAAGGPDFAPKPAARPRPAVHKAPVTEVEDETERLNRAQLKPSPGQ